MESRWVADTRVTYIIKQAQDALRKRMDSALTVHKLTMPMYAVLSMVLRNPEISNAALARACFVTPQGMNELVLHLERVGLIRRTPDGRNARILRAKLTAKGKKLASCCDKDVNAIESEMLQKFSQGERQQLYDMLSTCRDMLLSQKSEVRIERKGGEHCIVRERPRI